jgi:hypothetical protein
VIKGGGPKIEGTKWTVPERRQGSTRVTVHAVAREETMIKGGGPKIKGPGGQCQREGMGLLECQAMPSWRDVAHDGWLCTFTI